MLLISIFRLKNTFKCFFFWKKKVFGKIMKKPKKNSVFFYKHFERCFLKKKHFNFFNMPIISYIPFKNQIIFS